MDSLLGAQGKPTAPQEMHNPRALPGLHTFFVGQFGLFLTRLGDWDRVLGLICSVRAAGLCGMSLTAT